MKNMPILRLRSGMLRKSNVRSSKRHIIRNKESKESNKIAKKNNIGKIIRGVAAAVRAVVPEVRVVAGTKTQLTSVSSSALSHLSSLRRNLKNSQMRVQQQRSSLPLVMVATVKQATDK